MKIYHYTTKGSAVKILRLQKQGYLEFYLGSQEQSGHATGSYWSKKGPGELSDKPVSRYFGTEALPPQIACFEMDIPGEWETGKKSDIFAKLTPIKGDRGTDGIALCLTPGGAYAEPLGDSEEKLAQNDCICLPLAYFTKIYTLSSGKQKIVSGQAASNASRSTILTLLQ